MGEPLTLYVRVPREVVERAIEPPEGYQISRVFTGDAGPYEPCLCVELTGDGPLPESPTGFIQGRLRPTGRSTSLIEFAPLGSDDASRKVQWAMSEFGGLQVDGWGVSSNGTAHLYRFDGHEFRMAICNRTIDVGSLPAEPVWREPTPGGRIKRVCGSCQGDLELGRRTAARYVDLVGFE